MDKLLIILKKEGIRLYDIDGSKTKIHLIRGEEETDTEEYAEVAESLRDSYNDDELSEVELDLLYTNNNTEIVKGFTEELLPCGGWQVFSFKKILPEILLKNNMLKPDESVTVQYDGEAYTASMTKNGEIELTAAESGTELHDSDITAIYADKFNVFADEEKKEKQQRQIEKLQQEVNKLNDELKHTKNELKKSDKKKRELFTEFRIAVAGASTGKLHWKVEDGAFVKKGKLIATNASESWAKNANKDGILVHIAEAGTAMNNNVIGVIMHENDSAEDAREWAEKQPVTEDDSGTDSKVNHGLNIVNATLKALSKNL